MNEKMKNYCFKQIVDHVNFNLAFQRQVTQNSTGVSNSV